MGRYLLILTILLTFHFNEGWAQRTIQFAGQEWDVKSGFSSPGPNNWSDSSQSVWVDSIGRLHLKIRKIEEKWYCAEISARESFGFGEYRFYVGSNVENYASNVVVGLFIYENDSTEIDIEFPHHPDSPNATGWYTVQPLPYDSTNHERFSLNLSGNYSTHKFLWTRRHIRFESYHGHSETLPSAEFLINRWDYSGKRRLPAGDERLHINFWLFSGNPPGGQQESEFIINAIEVPSDKKGR